MKLPQGLKLTLLLTLALLYISGVVTWLADWRFEGGTSALHWLWLQLHSVVSLWFFVLFGYLFHAHVLPAWKKGKHLKSGATLTAVLIFLFLTVPLLFYLGDEYLKFKVALAHTYVGLQLIVVFFVHLAAGRRRRG